MYRKSNIKRQSNEASIKEVFYQFVDAFNIDYDPFEYEVKELWQTLTGSLTTRMTRKLYIQNSVLYIVVASPVLRHELLMVRGELAEKINRHFAEKYKQFENKKILQNIIIK
jgi:hypothetical protein